MRDSDELTNIPPIVPSRDDVSSHEQARRGQSQDIVRPTHRIQAVRVSTWPVRIVLTILCLTIIGAGAGAYYFYDDYQADLRQADLRIADLERRLALVGEDNEESVVNMQETLDFHFSEIDKLWAARNNLRAEMVDTQSSLARLGQVNEGQDETVAAVTQQVATAGEQITASNARINTVANELQQLTQSVAALDSSMTSLDSLRSELQSIQTEMNSGDDTLLGLAGRIEYVEESMESVNAHRLQINQSLFQLQENIEALQRQVNPAGL